MKKKDSSIEDACIEYDLVCPKHGVVTSVDVDIEKPQEMWKYCPICGKKAQIENKTLFINQEKESAKLCEFFRRLRNGQV